MTRTKRTRNAQESGAAQQKQPAATGQRRSQRHDDKSDKDLVMLDSGGKKSTDGTKWVNPKDRAANQASQSNQPQPKSILKKTDSTTKLKPTFAKLPDETSGTTRHGGNQLPAAGSSDDVLTPGTQGQPEKLSTQDSSGMVHGKSPGDTPISTTGSQVPKLSLYSPQDIQAALAFLESFKNASDSESVTGPSSLKTVLKRHFQTLRAIFLFVSMSPW